MIEDSIFTRALKDRRDAQGRRVDDPPLVTCHDYDVGLEITLRDGAMPVTLRDVEVIDFRLHCERMERTLEGTVVIEVVRLERKTAMLAAEMAVKIFWVPG